MEELVQLEKAEGVAADHGGVASRKLLADVGIQRHHISKQVLRRRWRLHGQHTVAIHTRDLSQTELFWRAVWECGATTAALDGVSALQAAGLKGYDESLVHVSIVHTQRKVSADGVMVHKIPRRHPGELVGAGVPRVRPALAAVRGAHAAVSDRQAALILAMTLQQRLCSAEQLLQAGTLVRGRRRRAFVDGVIRDVADGAHSLGELDFTAMCRRHRVPAPIRQVLRRGPRGRIYLDVRWEDGWAAEIDGAGHRWGLSVTSDNLRQNAVVIAGDRVLRLDTLGLRLEEAAFMRQVRQALIPPALG